jgi:hypothetical protein
MPAGIAQAPRSGTLPIITGDFIQGWQFGPYNQAQIDAHFAEIAGAGIRHVILQESARTEHGMIYEAYYPSVAHNDPNGNHPWCNDLLENMFRAAQKTNLKIWVGLNFSSPRGGIAQTGWFRQATPFSAINDRAWYVREANLGNSVAQEIYDLYFQQYRDVFYGWYFSFEYFNRMLGYEENYAEFFNINGDFLHELTPGLPVMMSPFFAADHLSVEATRGELTTFFQHARFRPGDVYAPQDCVGVGRATVAQAGEYFRMIREVMDATAPGVRFWANNENFNPQHQTYPPYRLLQQIEVTNPYVERHISFSFSHYYSTLGPQGNPTHLNAYRIYYQNELAKIAHINFGDVDGNGVVNAADVTMLRRFIASQKTADDFIQTEAATFNPANADVNFDGIINAADVSMLRRYIADSDRATFGARNPAFRLENANITGSGTANIGSADVSRLRDHISATDPTSVPLGS